MLVHDIDKLNEKDKINKAKEQGNLSLGLVMRIKKEGEEFLRDNGFDEDTIKLTGANIRPDDKPPEDLLEKIAWFADAVCDNDEIVTIPERFRRQLTNSYAGTTKAYFNALSYNGEAHDVVQQKIGHEICVEFSEKLGFTGDPDDLPLFIKEKFEERIRNS